MIPTQREYLHWLLGDALADWLTTHGEARERARYKLRSVIADIRRELRGADMAVPRRRRQATKAAPSSETHPGGGWRQVTARAGDASRLRSIAT